MDARDKRLAQNEALFREVNERLQEHADDGALHHYLCECANSDCTFRISISPEEYEAVRADARQFMVLPQHFTPEIEQLVSERSAYWVVRKTGEEGEYVEKLDPRSR
jgi:hypothetical protein